MNTAYFVKVSKSMFWNELKEKINKQKNNRIKPLPFIIVTIINVSSMDFDDLSQSLQKPSISTAIVKLRRFVSTISSKTGISSVKRIYL